MRVSVFGLGYVGSVSSAAFAADGHDVVGIDVNADKVAAINEGRSPIVEPGLGDLLQQGVRTGKLRATTSTADAINSSADCIAAGVTADGKSVTSTARYTLIDSDTLEWESVDAAINGVSLPDIKVRMVREAPKK